MTEDMTSPLSAKHQRFVDEFLVDFNATQAYIRAGYAPRTAKQGVWRLLRQAAVRAAIQAGQRRMAELCRVRADDIVAEYARIAFATMRDYVAVREDGTARPSLSNVTAEQWVAVAELRTDDYTLKSGARLTRMRLKLACKLTALEALGRHLGLFARKDEDDPVLHTRNLAEDLRAARERADNWESRIIDND